MCSQKSQKKNCPELRFPNFKSAWEVGNFESFGIQIIDGDRGKNYPKPTEFLQSGDCLFLSAKNVTKSGFNFEEALFVSKEKDEAMSKGKLEVGDVVLTTRGTLGQIALFDESVPFKSMRINSGMVLLRSDRNVDPAFLYQQLTSDSFQREVERIAFGSAQPQLTVGGIKKMPLRIPALPEQRKIASFLGLVDEKIGSLKSYQTCLENFKKGCTQRLLDQSVRFHRENGEKFPPWKRTKLGNLVRVTTGSSNREDSTEVGEFTFFDRSADVRASSKFLFDCEALIVAGEGKDFPARYFKGKFDLHQRAYAITEFHENSARYLYYWINWHRENFLKRSVGSTMPSLRMNSFTEFPIGLPCPAEQQKIADFLYAIDAKIDVVRNSLWLTIEMKKALLQRMLV